MGIAYTNAVAPPIRTAVIWRATDPGATPGETDSTAAIQAVIDSMQWGDVLDGPSELFNVTTLRMRSGITVRNLTLRSCAGSADHVAPVTIGDVTGAQVLSDITIENVHVNGNREEQTGITNDGYRFGFCILGRAHRITLRNCSASYCATDGLFMYNGSGTAAVSPLFSDIEVSGCRFEWNRRHGMAAASVARSSFTDCAFNHNGQDVGQSLGMPGSFGIDFELEQSGQACSDLAFTRVEARYNSSSGIVFSDHTGGSEASERLTFYSCTLGDNTAFCDNGALGFKYAVDSSVKKFRDVSLVGCAINGIIIGHSVDGLTIEGGTVTGQQLQPSYRAGSFLNSTRLRLTAQPDGLPWIFSPSVPLCADVQVGESSAISLQNGDEHYLFLASGMAANIHLVSGATIDSVVSLGTAGEVSATGEGSGGIGGAGAQIQFLVGEFWDWGWLGWQIKNNTGTAFTFSYGITVP